MWKYKTCYGQRDCKIYRLKASFYVTAPVMFFLSWWQSACLRGGDIKSSLYGVSRKSTPLVNSLSFCLIFVWVKCVLALFQFVCGDSSFNQLPYVNYIMSLLSSDSNLRFPLVWIYFFDWIFNLISGCPWGVTFPQPIQNSRRSFLLWLKINKWIKV